MNAGFGCLSEVEVGITGLGNRRNGYRFGCLSEVEVLLILIRRKNNFRRWG